MANTRVQGEQALNFGGFNDVTFSVTSGNCLVAVLVGATVAADITSVVWDTGGDNQSFTEVDSVQRSSPHSQWIFVLPAVASTKSGVVRATQSTGFACTMHVTEVSGAHASPIGASGTGSGTSATPTMSLITTAANSSIFALVSNTNYSALSTSAGTDYTKVTTGGTDGADEFVNIDSYDATEYDMDAGVSGSKTVDFGFGASCPWIIRAVEIKTAGAGGATIVNRENLRRGIARGVLRGV